jgi:hypothetical protein
MLGMLRAIISEPRAPSNRYGARDDLGIGNLAIGPGMLDLGQPMFDPVLLAAHVEHVCRVSCRRAVRVARWESELDPTVGENCVDLVGDGRDQSFEEGRGGALSRLPDRLDEGELAGAIDGE